MKRLLVVIAVIICMATGYAQSFDDAPKEKTAILMVHFGTTFDDTRALTIDAINERHWSSSPA